MSLVNCLQRANKVKRVFTSAEIQELRDLAAKNRETMEGTEAERAAVQALLDEALGELAAVEALIAEAMPDKAKPAAAPAPAPVAVDEVVAAEPAQNTPPVEAPAPAAPEATAAGPAPMPAVGGISMSLAQQAHSGTSFVPERRAEQERDSFKGALKDAWDRAARIAGTDPAAIARITEVFADVADGYRARYTATLQARSRVMSSMISGPARFPVERNRKRLETERKRAEEASEFLARGIKRLIRAARGPIDNSPESELERVRLNLSQREELQETMKAANAALRKDDDAALEDLGFTAEQIADLKKGSKWERGFPAYRLTNNNAEIRRLRERLQSAEERMQDAAAGPVETERPGVRIVEDATDDRLRLIFDGKPSEEVRNDLKANGFKWSPKNDAWQRQLTDNARYAAKQVLDKHYPADDAQAGGEAKFSRRRMTPAERADNFSVWGGSAPVVDREQASTRGFKTGEAVVVEAYHGTARPDRVGTVFQTKRATSGPMAFFTSDPTLASSYAQGKEDTSIGEDYDGDYSQWFKVKTPGRRAQDVAGAWWSLTPEQRDKITDLAPRVVTREDDDGNTSIELADEGTTNGVGNYEYEYRKSRNPLRALVENWLASGMLFNEEQDFLKVLKTAGFPMDQVEYDSPRAKYPFVYKTFIRMGNPLVTSDIPQRTMDALEQAAKRDRSRPAAGGADQWDKNTRTLREWVAQLKAGDGQSVYVWTSIPDKVTEVLKAQGHDGIIDWSGKGGGNIVAPVYIPFTETQVKSAIGNKGTFDPDKKDILYSRAPGRSVELEAADAVGREFWRKIDNGESFTDQEVLDALSINRRGSRRIARGMVAPADIAGVGIAPIEWQGDLASFGTYTSSASWDGDNFNVFFVPESLAQGADLSDYAQARDRALVHVSFRLADDGRYEISYNDPPAASTALLAAEKAGVAAKAGTAANEYRRIDLDAGDVQSREITQEAIRRLALNIGQTPAVFYPRRETGARAGQENTGRGWSKDYVREKFSRAPGSRTGVPMQDAEAVADAIRAAYPTGPQIVVLDDVRKAPEQLLDQIRAVQAANTVEGAYYKGKIYLFPQNVADIQRLMFVGAHHEIRHAGLDALFGKRKGALLLSIAMSNPKVAEAARAKMAEGVADSMIAGTEEALADMPLEDMAKLNGWNKIVAAVRQWLRGMADRLQRNHPKLAAMIRPDEWTDNDVAALIRRAEDISRGGTVPARPGGAVFSDQESPDWYSALADQVGKASMNAGPSNAWKALLKNWTTTGKVKADEVEWSGLNEWLDMQPGKITKAQVADYLRANGVQVQETVLGEPDYSEVALWWNDEGGANEELPFDELTAQGKAEAAERYADEVGQYQEGPRQTTKYANYTLPGGTNYREVLLTLPGKSSGKYWAEDAGTVPGYPNWMVASKRESDGETLYHGKSHATREAAERAIAELDGTKLYKSGHWDQPNILAHIRVNDRVGADGSRVLFVEELQSDYAQDARKKGIQKKPATVESLDDPRVRLERRFEDGKELTDVYLDGENVQTWKGSIPADYILADLNEVIEKRAKKGVPAAPYIDATDKWVALAMKRVIKMAVDGGYDKVAFVTGEQSADRYDLSKQVEAIKWRKTPSGMKGWVSVEMQTRGSRAFLESGPHKEGDLADVVGKELAERILQSQEKEGEIRGVDLKVGGEGMRAFYDKIVPAVAKDVLRKLGGGAMETVDIGGAVSGRVQDRQNPDYKPLEQPGFTITQGMKDKARGGMPLFSRADQTQTPASGAVFSRAGTAKTTAPDWITSGSAALQGAAGKIDTYAPQKTMAEKAREMSAGWKQKMVQGMFDAYAPLKALSMDAYIAARMTKAADGAFEGMLMYGKPIMQADGGITGDLDGKGFLGAMRELAGEHDRFFMWLAGNRAERLLSEGKENLFNADEIAAMKALNRGTMEDGRPRVAAFKRALDEFNTYSKSVLDVAEKAGLIDGESRKLWEHDFYVPFYRMSQENEISGPTKIKGLVRQKAFERLKGGKENLGDLMDNTLRNWSHLLSASLANVAASKSLLAAEQAGVAFEAKEAQAKEMAKAAGLKGNATYFMDQGMQRWFVVEDPAILQAVSAMEAPALNGLPLQLMAKFKKYLTVGVTIAPAFKVRNLIRDTLAAPAANEMSFNIAKNLSQGWKATDAKTAGYAQMLFSGGLMRFGTYLEGDRAEHVKWLISQGVDDKTILNTPQKVKAMVVKAWDAWQDFGDRMENVNRTALYQQLLDKGLSPREAAFQARDMMDFSLQGSWAATRTLTAVVPFLNARMQGIYKLGRAAADNPKRMGYMVGAVALASITLMLAYQDDDDWKAREDWDRDAWWWFKIGETAYRIPKPFEVGAMGTIAERSLELVINDEMTGKRFAERMKQMVTGTFAINPVPQMFKPMLDLYANKDSFTGRQIETLGMERLSKQERYGPNTSALAKALGYVSSLPNKAGLPGENIEVSPVQADHMIRAYFGWLGTMGAATVDAAVMPFEDFDRPAKKMDDYFGGFVKELPAASSRYLEDFYKQAKETSEAMADLRRAREVGDTEAAAEIMEERGDKVAQYRVYQQAQRQLADLNKRIRIVRGSTELDADAKRLRLDELTELRNRIARQVNDRMRAREAVLQ